MEIFEEKLVSIIVPVYNVEKYLQRAIDSACHQDYKNLQIILIDDGSTDCSGQICDDAAKKDDRIVVIHQNNRGLGPARNAGLQRATGDYLAFLDSDDWMAPTMISELVQIAEDRGLDIIVGQLFVDDGKECQANYIRNINKCSVEIYNQQTALKFLINDSYIKSHAWNKLYRKEVFDSVTYPDNKLPYEDIATTYKTFMHASKIGVYNKPLYYYFQREESLSRTDDRNKKLQQEYYRVKAIIDRQKDIAVRFPDLKYTALSQSDYWCLYLYNEAELIDHIDNSIKKKCQKESANFFKEYFHDIKKDQSKSRQHILRIWLLMYCPFIYKLTLRYTVKKRGNFS